MSLRRMVVKMLCDVCLRYRSAPNCLVADTPTGTLYVCRPCARKIAAELNIIADEQEYPR